MATYKLFNKNCMCILKKLKSNSIDLIVTDPPYRTTARGCTGTSGGMFLKKINKSGMVFENNDISVNEYAPEFYRVLKDGSHLYIMSNHTNLISILNTCVNCGFHFIKSLIWDKQNKIMGCYYMSQFEYILFFRKGRGVKINYCGTSDIISIRNKKLKDEHGHNLHDTEKPVELMKILIKNSSKPFQTVMDPFVGIGSSGIASIELNRNFIGCETDTNYFIISKNRIEQTAQTNNI